MAKRNRVVATSHNPFHYSGPLPADQLIDRDGEAADLLDLAEGGHSVRLVGPRRYGKTSLLLRVLDDAEKVGMATVLVDLEDVLTVGGIVVRIERAYNKRLKGKLRKTVASLFNAWNIGLSLGAGGFALRLQRTPQMDAQSVLLRLLELPAELYKRSGARSLIVLDEVQDVLAVKGADGIIRSVIQHTLDAASYAFAGSTLGMMEQMFADPRRPLLEQAVAKSLEPLPLDDVRKYVAKRFTSTKRNVGTSLSPFIEFTRGHPQRSMMLAHYMWSRTPRGKKASEHTWVAARDAALSDSEYLMRAIWKGMSTNEQRMAIALAVSPHDPESSTTRALVGIKRGSVKYALGSLAARGDTIETQDGSRLTDPLFEYWLQRRGIV